MLIGAAARALTGVSTLINGETLSGIDYPFYCVMDEQGNRQMLRIMRSNVVRLSGNDEIQSAVVQIFKEELVHLDPYFQWPTAADIAACTKLVFASAQALSEDEIMPIAEASYKGYAYSKLDFDLNCVGEHPTFDRIFENMMSNQDAVKAFIGSLFDDKADRSQYVYLYGGGGNGKGRLIDFLSRTLKWGCASALAPKQNERFWFSAYYNKRLLTFTDVNDFKVVSTTEIKTITGDDYVPVERKNKEVFKAKARCKLMFASNFKPKVSSFEHDTRRIIAVYMKPVPEDERMDRGDIDSALNLEAHAFLSTCWRKYLETVKPNGGAIPCDREFAEALADEEELDFLDAIDTYFFVDPDLVTTASDFSVFEGQVKWAPGKMAAFRSFVSRRYGSHRKRGIVKKSREMMPRGITGLGLRPEVRRLDGQSDVITPRQPAYSARSEADWTGALIEWGYAKGKKEGHDGSY